MVETLIAAAVAGLLLAVGLLHRLTPWLALLRAGAWLILLGVVSSLVAGGFYHWALWRALGPRQALPPRWWLNPTALHPRLTPAERALVLPWFALGATAFGVVMLGCIGVLLAVIR